MSMIEVIILGILAALVIYAVICNIYNKKHPESSVKSDKVSVAQELSSEFISLYKEYVQLNTEYDKLNKHKKFWSKSSDDNLTARDYVKEIDVNLTINRKRCQKIETEINKIVENVWKNKNTVAEVQKYSKEIYDKLWLWKMSHNN